MCILDYSEEFLVLQQGLKPQIPVWGELLRQKWDEARGKVLATSLPIRRVIDLLESESGEVGWG